jgi:nucleoside-diphosphate-sugar epimerase
MRVFVAGATGVAGRRAVIRLVAAGHEVTGVSRSAEKDALLESSGARPVRVDLFDRSALESVVAGHDAVVNLATKIPPLAQMGRMSAWKENERIRREASTNLVDAAIAAGASVFVQESLAFMYGDHGANWIDASTTPLASTAFSGALEVAEANVERFRAQGRRGVVLRFGRFYAADSDQAATIVRTARRGLLLDLGGADSYAPVIDADDVASAVVAALEAPAGTYDVVDDEPMTRAEQSRVLAAAVGRRRLWPAPRWATPNRARFLAASQRVSNERFRAATGWRPASRSVSVGFPKLVRELRVEPALRGWSRLMLWILAISSFGVGVQAAFFPRSFYDDFPFGRGWVAMDGRYNQHLIRDVGELNLALLVLTVCAIFVGTRTLARITAASWLVYSVPHLVYHLRHLSMPMSGAEKVVMVVSLSGPIIAAIVVLFDRPRPARAAIDLRSVEDRAAPTARVAARR